MTTARIAQGAPKLDTLNTCSSHMVQERPSRSTLDVAVEALLRQLAVEIISVAQTISDAMTSRGDLLASLLQSERQETSSSPQSLNDDCFGSTPAQRRDSGCTWSRDTGTDPRDDSSETL